jgi:hypothetical protein
MNDLQLFYQADLPVILILVGIILSECSRGRIRDEIKDVRGEVTASRRELATRIDRIAADLAAFYKITGVLEGRLDEISKK